jgi:hypothetical protein
LKFIVIYDILKKINTGKCDIMKKQSKLKALKNANAITVFLVLLIICLLAGYVLIFLNDRYGFDGSEPLGMDKYEIEICINDADVLGLSYFKTYHEYCISTSNTFLGTVNKYERDAEKEDCYILKLYSIGTYSNENGFKLNGAVLLSAGDVVKINNGYDEFYAEVLSIKKIEAE